MTGNETLCFHWYKTASKKSQTKHFRFRKWKFHCSKCVPNLAFSNGFKIYFTNKLTQAPIDETVSKEN